MLIFVIDLLLQYITGYKIIVFLWFIQILIFFELIFQIIYILFKKLAFRIFQILLILSYFLQYSEINYRILLKYSSHLRAFSHIVEMMPLAITELILREINIFEKLSNFKIKSIIISMITLFFYINIISLLKNTLIIIYLVNLDIIIIVVLNKM